MIEQGLVRCVVAGYNAMGEPDFYFCKVKTKELNDIDVQTKDDEYPWTARQAAIAEGYGVDELVIFDEFDGPKGLFDLFVWASASVLESR